MIIALLGVVLVLFLTYYCTKHLSVRMSNMSNSKYIRIIDRSMLGQNKYIAIACIVDKYYLISVADNNINILKEMETFVEEQDSKDNNSYSFKSVFMDKVNSSKNVLIHKRGSKSND